MLPSAIMERERLYALPASTSEKKQVAEINSENIASFLGNPDIWLFKGGYRFADELHIPFFRPILESLYAETKEVYVMSEDYRQAWGEVHERFGVSPDDLHHAKGPAERSSVLYYDRKKGTLDHTPPLHGEYYSTESSFVTVLQEGHSPLIEAHTHPHDRLPSPEDYKGMLFNIGGNKRTPLANGILVACPNMQLLALRRFSSPLKVPKELSEYISKLEMIDGYKDGYEMADRRTERMLVIFEKSMQRKAATFAQTEHYLKEIDDQVKEKTLSKEDARIESRLLKAETEEHLDWITEKMVYLWSLNDTLYAPRINSALNLGGLDLMRQLDMQLYISEDMENFKAFSA